MSPIGEKIKSMFSSNNGSHKFDCRFYLIIASLILTMFIAALDIVIGIAIINQVSKDFNSYTNSGWVLSAYTLTSALFTLVSGRISLKIGLKMAVITSIVIFEIGSLISGVSNSMNMLIGSRVIAGIGAGGIQSLCYVCIPFLVDPTKIGSLNALFSATYGIAAFLGCIIGGTLIDRWRICYLINIPIGCVALIFLILVFPSSMELSTKKSKNVDELSSDVDIPEKQSPTNLITSTWNSFITTSTKLAQNLVSLKFYVDCFYEIFAFFDLIEFGLISISFSLLLVGLTYGVQHGNAEHAFNATYDVIIMLVFSGVSFILAIIWDLKLYQLIIPNWYYNKYQQEIYQPLFSARLLTEWKLVSLNMINFFISMTYFSVAYYSIQYYMLVFGENSSNATSHYTCFIATPIAATIAGRLNANFGLVKEVIILAVGIGMIGTGLLSRFDHEINSVSRAAPLVLVGVMYGGTIQTILLGLQIQTKDYGVDEKSESYKTEMTNFTSTNSFFRILGSALAGVIANIVFDSTFKRKLNSNTNGLPANLQKQSVNFVVLYRVDNFDSRFSVLGQMIADSIVIVFWVTFAFQSVSFLLSLTLSNKRSMVAVNNSSKKNNGMREEPIEGINGPHGGQTLNVNPSDTSLYQKQQSNIFDQETNSSSNPFNSPKKTPWYFYIPVIGLGFRVYRWVSK
ncbi:hypothetical protein ACO0QE_000989 [Hanseniaspora vineae]